MLCGAVGGLEDGGSMKSEIRVCGVSGSAPGALEGGNVKKVEDC